MAAMPKRTDIDVKKFHAILTKESERLRALHGRQRAAILEESIDDSENEQASYSTLDPAENMDTGAVLADQEREMAQDENLQYELQAIDHALSRIESGDYGICEVTGLPIPIERLRALPWAVTVVDAS